MLSRLQRGLEDLYRIDTGVSVEDFIVDEAMRDTCAPTRKSREQLLVAEQADEMSLALYIEPRVLENLAAHDPTRALGDHNLGDFLLAIEGVSHFIYAICCARVDRPVTQLELELQAEVDKYVTCLLVTGASGAPLQPGWSSISPLQPGWSSISTTLRHRLFTDCEYDADLDGDEHARYRAANDNAHRYASYLEQTYVTPRRIPEMLGELRGFYRQGLAAKLSRIARAA